MNQKLGICIPTYNRPDQLQLCVKSVIKAAAPYEVPIFIADDSTDTTNQEVLKALKNQYRFIYITKNEVNLGIDRNILNSVNLCRCEYAWMLGEDDRLQPDAVQSVMPVLETYGEKKLPFIFVNYGSVDAQVEYYLKEQALTLDEDTKESAELFLTQHSWAAGFIGGCIVNMEIWNQVDQEKYIGTYFAHVGSIMEMLVGSDAYLIARPLVMNRCGEPRLFSWSDSTFTVVQGWEKMMALLSSVYASPLCEEAIKKFELVHGLYTFRFLCYARADYAYQLKHYHEFLKPLGRGPAYGIVARTIACTPPQVFKTIRFLITRYRRIVNKPAKFI